MNSSSAKDNLTASLVLNGGSQRRKANGLSLLHQNMNKQEQIVSRFAALLGTSTSTPKEREILGCFSESLPDDAVVCTLPSLDMKYGEECNALPKVGEHAKKIKSTNDLQLHAKSNSHPVMEASILNSTADANADAAALEQKAAQRLCTKSSWTKSSVVYAPHALSKNVAEAFTTLVESRVRAWTLLLFRHSLSSGDSASRSRLLSMLSASIEVNSALTSLKTLPLPESAAQQKKEADVILPLLFEVNCEIVLQHRTDKVTLRAPGTISAQFEDGSTGIRNVSINLDTGALLSSMVDQARLAVFKTVAKVTSNEGKAVAVVSAASALDAAPVNVKKPLPAATSLSSFSSSLKLTAAKAVQGGNGPSSQLEKAKSSALRLNSVLQGKSTGKTEGSLAGSRKNRSVQWNHPMEIPLTPSSNQPAAKRLRMAHTSARLKSIKSFGRPHAGDFKSGPRNATFGNFGGAAGLWGRDGKMVHHPSPMNNIRQDLLGSATTTSPSRNASFSKLSKNTNQQPANRLPNSLPRTATALESWLVNATKNS